ncbi:hypothetical protein BH09MYX1_BH09MYX1_04280 [soil metagenome]
MLDVGVTQSALADERFERGDPRFAAAVPILVDAVPRLREGLFRARFTFDVAE